MMSAGFVCMMLFVVVMVGAFLINVVLPIYLIIKIIRWIIQYRETGELPWHRKPKPPVGGAGAGELKAAFNREMAASAQQQPAAVKAEEPAAAAAAQSAAPATAQHFESRRKEELYTGLKQKDRLERLALVYYVEDALRSGMTPEAVGAALRSKGWQEETIKAVLPQAA